MKRSQSVTLIFGLLCGQGALPAQTSSSIPTAPSAPKPSIVMLSFNAAVLGTAEAQRNLGVLQKKYSPREQQLQKLNDDIEASKKSLNDNAAKLTDADKSRLSRELDTKEKQLQRETEDLRSDSEAESQQVFQQVAQKVFSFLQEFSKQHGYSAVLERGSDAAPVVWYAASNIDITDQIVKGYDAKFGSGASTLPEEPAAPRPAPASPPNQP
jgi:outer membrane protein